jgi:hypothetical protein
MNRQALESWYIGPKRERQELSQEDEDAFERNLVEEGKIQNTFDGISVPTSNIVEKMMEAFGLHIAYAIDGSKMTQIQTSIDTILKNVHQPSELVNQEEPIVKRQQMNEGYASSEQLLNAIPRTNGKTLQQYKDEFKSGKYNGRRMLLKDSGLCTIVRFNPSKPVYAIQLNANGQSISSTLEFVVQSLGWMTRDEILKEAFISKYGNVFDRFFTTPFTLSDGQEHVLVGFDTRNKTQPIITRIVSGVKKNKRSKAKAEYITKVLLSL